MICFLNYSISPYHKARFSALKAQLNEEIVFIELASRDKIYEWRSQGDLINAITLFPGSEFSKIPSSQTVNAVHQVLEKLKPDIVLSISYASAPMRYGSIWARRNHAVSICVNDSWKGDKRRWFFWEWFKGLWCRIAYDGMFLSGERCRAYYQDLGFPGDKIWLGQNSVDNDYYRKNAQKVRENADEIRNLKGLPENFFLCVARLSPEKNLARLFRAFALYKSRGGEWALVLVGSGPSGEYLKRLAKELGIEGQVFFEGWKQVDEMPAFYGLAKCLILPSISEAWGNVVNEAMASGLPVLVSDKCGCKPELCFRGVNGYDFHPYKVESILNAMEKISSQSSNLDRMGQISADLISRFSLYNYSKSLLDCISTLRLEK